MNRIHAIAGLVLVTSLGSAQALTVYTVESPLLIGPGTDMTGKDNWRSQYTVALGNSGFDFSAGMVETGTGFNTSQVIGRTGSLANREVYGGRVNDANFNFNIDFNSEQYVFQYDVRWGSVVYAALGVDQLGAGGNNVITDSAGQERSTYLLYTTGSGIGSFSSPGATSTGLPATLNAGDWVTVRMVIDWKRNFYANISGLPYYNGEGDVYYKNLTDGETTFTPVANMQNLNLGNSTGNWSYYARQNPNYQGFALRVDAGQMDNLAVDNLPEPASAAMLIAAASAVLGRRRKQRG
jgi:hypothetical protein